VATYVGSPRNTSGSIVSAWLRTFTDGPSESGPKTGHTPAKKVRMPIGARVTVTSRSVSSSNRVSERPSGTSRLTAAGSLERRVALSPNPDAHGTFR
jgi:hypothetical protein